jgi:hypothetical protein
VFSNVTPIILIFVVPSVASLVVTPVVAHLGALWVLWSAGALSIVAFGLLALSLATEPSAPAAVTGGTRSASAMDE